MAQMVNSNRITNGFVKPVDNQTVIVPFGKALTDYIIIFEMTETSLNNFKEAGLSSGNKTIAFLCKYKLCGELITNHTLALRYNFSTGAITNGEALQYPVLNNDHFQISSRDITNASALVLYNGYEYKYTVIDLS